MNGQNPNLNGQSNNSFGSTSLGSVQNPNNQEQMINNGAVESLDVLPNNPVAQPIPGTEGTLTSQTVGSNNNFTPSGNVNGFTSANKMDNIGVVPPIKDQPKKKSPIGKIFFVLLIIVLICGVAYGVYYFLSISNNAVKVTTKTVTIGLGETVPDDINEYATASYGNLSSCSLNTKNVDSQKLGEYEVLVVCGSDVYKTKVVVSDITPPVASINMVFKTVNTTATIEEFVKSCTDSSNCKTSFVDETKLNEYLKTVGGPYDIEIEAVDDLGNKESYTATLYVTSEDISLFANFASGEEKLTEYDATKVINDVFAINKSLSFLNVARRDYTYTFVNEEDYKEVIKDKTSTFTFDNITGNTTYDDKNLKFTISTNLSLDTLNSENNGTFPTAYQDIQAIYKNTKGYTNTFIKEYPQVESEE